MAVGEIIYVSDDWLIARADRYDPIVDDYDLEYRDYCSQIARREPKEIPWPDQQGKDTYLRKNRPPKGLLQHVLDPDIPLDHIEYLYGCYGLPELMDGNPIGVKMRWAYVLGKPVVQFAMRDMPISEPTGFDPNVLWEHLYNSWVSRPKYSYLTPATTIYRWVVDAVGAMYDQRNPARFLRFDLAPEKPVVAQVLMRYHEVQGMGHLRSRKTFPDEVLKLARRHERKYLPEIG